MAGSMEADGQLARWQRKFDRDFPKGLLAAWDDLRTADGTGPRAVYLVPRVEATAMQGLNPVVALPVPGWEKVVTPGAVMAYQQVLDVSPKMFRVTFADGRSMSWGAGVSRAQAQATDSDRRSARDHFVSTGRSYLAASPEEAPDAGGGLPQPARPGGGIHPAQPEV